VAYLGGIRRLFPSRCTIIFTKKTYRHSAWTSGARPSVAGALTLKQCSRVHQNTLFSFRKLKNFLGRAQHPNGTWETPSHTMPLRRLRRFDPRAFGAQPLAAWPPFQNPKYATAVFVSEKLAFLNHQRVVL